jgi:hypothetical protein
MADKGGLQLLPETRKKIDIKVPGENRLIYWGVVLIILVLGAYAALWVYTDNLVTQIQNDDNQLMALEKQRDKKAEQSLLTLSKQIGITKQVLDNHIYWTTGLTKIESALQGSIQFKSFSAGLNDGTFSMRALSDTYTTLSRQLASFTADDAVKDVTLDAVNPLTNGKLDFNAKITFDKTKFLKAR